VEDIESCLLEPGHNLTDNQNRQIGYNNNLIPFINLRTRFTTDISDTQSENEKLVIINRHDKLYAIVAENIIGEYQAVIKPLGKSFSGLKFLSGASLLGDGSIALLLDTEKLWYEIN
jgi:two-component system chemotaxis sensor kinase CheA